MVYQKFLPLLSKSNKPIFIYVSSVLGSLAYAGEESPLTLEYGATKAAGNYITRIINAEGATNGVTAFAIHRQRLPFIYHHSSTNTGFFYSWVGANSDGQQFWGSARL